MQTFIFGNKDLIMPDLDSRPYDWVNYWHVLWESKCSIFCMWRIFVVQAMGMLL